MITRALITFAALALGASALAEVRVDGALTHHQQLQPGATHRGVIKLSNPADLPASATITLTDYAFQADGTSSHDAAGSNPRSNAKWIVLDRQRVTLPANSKLDVHYVLKTPINASGTYWSAVHVTPELPPATGTGLALRNRISYMVQVVTDLPGGQPRVRFTNPQLTRDEQGKYAFSVDTLGEGERWTVRTLTLEAYDQTGKVAATSTSRKRRLYPGTSLRDTFTLDLAPGTYTLVVVADDDEHAFGARYQVQVK